MAQFKGADEKTYELRLSLGALRRFERKTGRKLLKVCFGSVRSLAKKSEDEISDALFAGLGEIFESLDDAARLVYECSVPRAEQAETDFDAFCDDVLEGPAVGEAVRAIFMSITEQVGAAGMAAGLAGGTADADPKTAGE